MVRNKLKDCVGTIQLVFCELIDIEIKVCYLLNQNIALDILRNSLVTLKIFTAALLFIYKKFARKPVLI